MTARILIVDGVATNRIVMKVKMQAAQFAVTACATPQDAEAEIKRRRPDLILVNPTDGIAGLKAICQSLQARPETRGIAVIATGGADTAKDRFAALDSGADDVLPHPVEDTLLFARIRSLLRIKSAGQELALRDSTSRALGFDDARQIFHHPARIAYVAPHRAPLPAPFDRLAQVLGRNFSHTGLPEVLRLRDTAALPDLIVLDLREAALSGTPRFDLISELRARASTRLVAVMVVVPEHGSAEAALHLDLGADDVVFADVGLPELQHRLSTLGQRKLQQDSLRASVREGLHAALTDPLTGLFNRRYVMPHLKRMAEESAAVARPFAVMMLDIDHFKAINDHYGHAVGDEVLVAFALRLRQNLRAIDLVGRVGGEEFLVAMPRTSGRAARIAANRLRRIIGNTPFQLEESGVSISVSVSVGVAVSAAGQNADKPLAQLCHHADSALYRAKTAGRNRVAMAQPAA